MRLQLAKDEFFKYSNDLVQSHQSKKSGNTKSGLFKNVLSEYNITACDSTHVYPNKVHTYSIPLELKFLPSSHYKLPEQPPEVI
jgi:hypothetical protein